MIKWALLGWLSSSLTDQLIRLISSRDNWQSLHHHHSYKQTSEAQVNQVIFNRSPPRFWNGPVHSKVFLMFLSFCIQTGIRELSLSWKPRDPIIAQISNLLFFSYFGFFCCGSVPRRSFFSDLEVSKATYANHYSESKWMKDFWFTSFIDSVAKSPPTLHF